MATTGAWVRGVTGAVERSPDLLVSPPMKRIIALSIAALCAVFAPGAPAGAQVNNFVNFDSVAPNPVDAGTPVGVQVTYTMQTVSSPLVQITGSVSAGTIANFGVSPPLTCTTTTTDYACAGMTAGTIYQVSYQIQTGGLAGTTITLNAGETEFGVAQQTTVQVQGTTPTTPPPTTATPTTPPPTTVTPTTAGPGTTAGPATTAGPGTTADPGTPTTTASGAGGAGGAGTGGGTLPSTGSNDAELVMIALLLVAIGGLVVFAVRLPARSED